ncbi:MAG: (deoxy)nucleoside triphosphate pyrophosphohydrolase [Chitinophagaceae bacterium]|nr:(deoxy)nucleoside triphosphate pyrophosphohydrolase [Chitinophagaceae bacterium]
MKPIEVVCAIIIHKKKILVAQRSETMKLPLKWEFPGGKINSNESKEECIHRELQEELNIQVIIQKEMPKVFHDYGSFSINLLPFIVQYHKGVIKTFEHNEIKWLSRQNLHTLDWAAADLLVLQEFLKVNEL